MESPISPNALNPDPTAFKPVAQASAARLDTIAHLVEDLDRAPAPVEPAEPALQFENQLVQVRLGLASSMFLALRGKHPPTASHSLRVAMSCSAWGLLLGMSEADRDELEIAGLLHDVGKITIPDAILLKPGGLTPEELRIVEGHRTAGVEILRGCCASNNILEAIRYAGTWQDGSRGMPDRKGDLLPPMARVISIVDAFDSMTTNQVFRRGMSRERAVAELFDGAGTQFDPQLVRDFCEYLSADQGKLMAAVCRRWLKELEPAAAQDFWKRGNVVPQSSERQRDDVFQEKLLEHMHDAVIFVDVTRKIVLWNRAAERLTGIPVDSVLHQTWEPHLIRLSDEKSRPIPIEECPVMHGIVSGAQSFRRMRFAGRNGQSLTVDAHVIPVIGSHNNVHGATLLLRDASSQISLEERVQTLHVQASRDPLTRAANRAEFDRSLQQMVESHLERNLPCSLIIADIDHFKKVNDTYGHQAGDEVLVSYASLLQRHTRPGDLVARYGGEEFVILCADCDNHTATSRAEKIRQELGEMPQAVLNGQCITSSFGVTELQAGDTPQTMINRADRALYQAKENGRNTVVQLGSGIAAKESKAPAAKEAGWFSWILGGKSPPLVDRRLVTPVPMSLTAEKLKGFIADHHAELISVSPQNVVLRIDGEKLPNRRTNDRAVAFLVELNFEENRGEGERRDESLRTLVRVQIRPRKDRDRRRQDSLQRAEQIISSLRSYLVAQDYAEAAK